MGRVSAPFGVSGWVRIQPYTESAESLAAYRTWWLGSGSEWKAYRVARAQAQGAVIVAKFDGCDDRDAAAALRGQDVAVSRDDLPQAGVNEWYWTDLIGLAVVNTAGDELGRVARIVRTGANDVLVVEGERERLIPFIEDVVREVDLAAGVVRVDWSADF